MAQQWVNPCSHMNSLWICIVGERTLKLLILILGGLRLWNGVFEVFAIWFQLIPNNWRWHSNQSAPIHIWVPADCTLWKNRFTSLWISFSVFVSCRNTCFSPFNSGPNWVLTIPDGMTKNSPIFSSGFQLIPYWWRRECQAFESHAQVF